MAQWVPMGSRVHSLEIPLGVARHARRLAGVWLGVLAGPGILEAQAGFAPSLAEVQLVARVAPRGTIESVGPEVETGRRGPLREVLVMVALSANTGYRLVVVRTDAPPVMPAGRAPQLWVRALDGKFQALDAGKPVVVARGGQTAGQWVREVGYKMEEGDSFPPPCRCATRS
jgi:hypothetical protein